MINKTTQQLETAVPSAIAALQRESRALKNKQLLGSDNMVVLQSGSGSLTVTVLAGRSYGWGVNFVSTTARQYYVSEPGFWLYVDNNNDPNYIWPNGPSLSIGQLAVGVSGPTYDPVQSNEGSTGVKHYNVWIHNFDTVSHTYYMNILMNFVKGTA